MRADTLFLDDAAVESFNPNLYYPSPPPPRSFWTSFQRRLSRQIYQPPVFRPVETPWKRI